MVSEAHQNNSATGGVVGRAGATGDGVRSVGPPRKGEQLCCVTLPDESQLELNIDKKAKGQDLFDKVLRELNIFERDYFGLSFRDTDDKRSWLYFKKPISKQLKSLPWIFRFEIKFYPSEPSQLKEDITRYYLCLQVRNDIVSGKLPCSFMTHCLLASYLAQSHFGDYDDSMGPPSEYLANFPMAPKPTWDMAAKVHELHKSYRGQTPAEAEAHYLENAKKLAMYGVDLHPAKDSDNVDIMLGICASGLNVYRDKLRVNRFAWPKILKIAFRRKFFYIHLKPGEFEQYESTIGFRLPSYKAAKRMWKTGVEHHAFFRLMAPEVPNKEKGSLLPRLGSSRFRYAGRTQYQSRLASSLVDRPTPTFQRSASGRVPNSHSVDSAISSKVPPSTSSPDEGLQSVGYIDDKSSADNLDKQYCQKAIAMFHEAAPILPYSRSGSRPENIVLPDKDLAELRRQFNEIDRNRNGRLGPDEVRRAIRGMGLNPTENWVDQLIRDADTDGNGTIEWPEFHKYMTKAGSGYRVGPSGSTVAGLIRRKEPDERRREPKPVESPKAPPVAAATFQQQQQPEQQRQPIKLQQQPLVQAAGATAYTAPHYGQPPKQQQQQQQQQQQPKYTDQQLRDLRNAFELFDKDKNGHITPEELREVIRSVGLEPNDEWIQQLLDQADTDKSGTIEWEEFLVAMGSGNWIGGSRKREKPPPPKRTVTKTVTTITVSEEQLEEISTMFKTWDKNNDGYVTKKELEEGLKDVGMNPKDPWVGEFIQECDTDRDGRISWPEFVRLMTISSAAATAEEEPKRTTVSSPVTAGGSPSTKRTNIYQVQSGHPPHHPGEVTTPTSDQLREIRSMFKTWDTNNDGYVTQEELDGGLRQVGMDPSEQWVADFIHECDTDRDGRISWPEFLRLMTVSSGTPRSVTGETHETVSPVSAGAPIEQREIKRVQAPRPPHGSHAAAYTPEQLKDLRKYFEMYDKNRDGHITPDELRQVIRSVGLEPDNEWVAQLIAESDTDKSGTIEWEEFLAKMAGGGGGLTSPPDRSKKHKERGGPGSGVAVAAGAGGGRQPEQPTTRLITRRVTTVTITEEQLKELRQTFEMWDKDKNGYLTEGELRSVLGTAGMKPDEAWVTEFIRECDTNRDGKISWPEFLRLMTVGSPSHPESPPTETYSRIVAYKEASPVGASPPPEAFVERHQEVSEGDPNVRTERIVNPDGSITTRTITSKVRTVKQTVKTTQLLPSESITYEMKEEDVVALRRAFDLFDKDKDDRISRDEMRDAIKSLGMTPTDQWIDQIFRDSDLDRSGTISWPEFLRAMAAGPDSPLGGSGRLTSSSSVQRGQVVQDGGGGASSFPSSAGGVPVVQTHSWNVTRGSAATGGGPHSPPGAGGSSVDQSDGRFVSAQAVDSGSKVVDQETFKTEKDGVVEIRTVKKVTVQSSGTAGDGIDHEAALTAAILEATKVDPDVMVEKVEYRQQSQS